MLKVSLSCKPAISTSDCPSNITMFSSCCNGYNTENTEWTINTHCLPDCTTALLANACNQIGSNAKWNNLDDTLWWTCPWIFISSWANVASDLLGSSLFVTSPDEARRLNKERSDLCDSLLHILTIPWRRRGHSGEQEGFHWATDVSKETKRGVDSRLFSKFPWIKTLR